MRSGTSLGRFLSVFVHTFSSDLIGYIIVTGLGHVKVLVILTPFSRF